MMIKLFADRHLAIYRSSSKAYKSQTGQKTVLLLLAVWLVLLTAMPQPLLSAAPNVEPGDSVQWATSVWAGQEATQEETTAGHSQPWHEENQEGSDASGQSPASAVEADGEQADRGEQRADDQASAEDGAPKTDAPAVIDQPVEHEIKEAIDGSWLVKWRDLERAQPLPDTVVLHREEQMRTELVRPSPGMDIEEWLIALRSHPDIEYVQANGRVGLLASVTPDDPFLEYQSYLDQIGARKAWESVTAQTDLTIALVDTGVDLNHPDLKDNLVKGTNLVQQGKQPQDDNGHGTRVAGVLAAIGNNGKGTAGIVWNARVMPIKALDADGYGDEDRLGEAIMYAVKNGAKIVVLSVGLYRASPYMQDIVEYAEDQGVLLIAATGNDGLKFKNKVAVKYPAAYPSVLAVGGASADGKAEPRSNSGPEVDIVAPWNVYTTALGGGYAKEQGTSMAAPQAAGVAALVWAKYPHMEPYQIRELLRQTAKDVGAKGWDEQTGYGLLQADQALTASYRPDAREPNDTRASAAIFPLSAEVPGQLTTGKDKDVFKLDIPYDGTLEIRFQGLVNSGQAMPPVTLAYYSGSQKQEEKLVKTGTRSVEWKVKKGTGYLELKFADAAQKETIPYLLTSAFTIAPDDFEDNDSNYKAFTLPARSQKITGNFHQTGDRDWFAITFTQSGTLRVKMETNTVRIDPAIAVGRAGERMMEIDEHSDGETEESALINVTPGKYFIRTNNAAASNASPVIGTYTLTIEILSVFDDPNEPNNKSYEATSMRPGTDYVGVIDPVSDEDWFQLRLTGDSIVSIQLSDIPSNRSMNMEVLDRTQKSLFTLRSTSGSTAMTTNRRLSSGTYYIKLSASSKFNYQYYRLRAEVEKLVAGFRDVDGHWATDAITALTKNGIIQGTGGYKFEPNRPITRAEAVALLIKAFPPAGGSTRDVSFKDLKASHWAYNSIRDAVHAGWIQGYSDNTFAPDRNVTRAEMAMMLSAAMSLETYPVVTAPFSDVKPSHWAAPVIAVMKQSELIGGYADNRFRPSGEASRAEFSAILYRAMR